MILLAVDENFNNDILRGLLRIKPNLDIVRIQDVGLSGADDKTVLEWASREKRILLTQDVATITKYVYERIKEKKYVPGVFEINSSAPIKRIIEDILLLAECSFEDEWANQILYLPLH